MSIPYKDVIANSLGDGTTPTHQRNPSWVVAFIRFMEPNCINTTDIVDSELVIVKNDCISVDINNTKSDYLKTAMISLKPTDVWYPGYIASGDWVCVWVQDSESEIDRIVSTLKKLKYGSIPVGNILCGEKSGLKFIGRVNEISTSDQVSSNGQRSIIQSVTAHSFMEFTTSIYFNYGGQALATPAGKTAEESGTAVTDGFAFKAELSMLDTTIKNYATQFYKFYSESSDWAPDTLVALHLLLGFGISSDAAIFEQFGGVGGSPNDAIWVPSVIFRILNKPIWAKKYWELLNIYLGIQKYPGVGGGLLDNNILGGTPWYAQFETQYNPIKDSLTQQESIFKRCTYRCRGMVPFDPALPNNQTIWSWMDTYKNEVVNEMYTSLRIDGKGNITPTLTVREKPFSTGLFSILPDKGAISAPSIPSELTSSDAGTSIMSTGSPSLSLAPWQMLDDSGNSTVKNQSILSPGSFPSGSSFLNMFNPTTRTLYGTLPRWKINETMIRQYSYSTNEANRINFVQVWGSSSAAEFTGQKIPGGNDIRMLEYNNGNYQSNNIDIKRHGLRLFLGSTQYDQIVGGPTGGSLAGLFAKLNADWLYNGHLKATGSVVLNGVVDPIVEGDNCQIRDIVYHIESVHHSCSISANGIKSFTTTLQLSNGLLQDGLENPSQVPKYPYQKGHMRYNYDSPGWTVGKAGEPSLAANLENAVGGDIKDIDTSNIS